MGDGDRAASKPPDTNDEPVTNRLRSQRSPSPVASHISRRIKPASLVSASSSVGESPKSSREASPSRNGFRTQSTTSRLSRSRKNSQELVRNNISSISDTPSPAAIQRALAAAGPNRPTPLTLAETENRSQKSSRTPSVTRSIRLTSPPPVSGNAKRELEPPPTPSIIVNQPTPKSASSFENIEEEGEQMLTPGVRSPVRLVTTPRLAAVQESIDPETPALASGSKQFFDESRARGESVAEPSKGKNPTMSPESGNESAGGQSIASNATIESKIAKPALHPRRSYSQMTVTKNRNPTDSTLRNMSVETETVVSMPSMVVGVPLDARNSSGKQDPNSTLRMKASTETLKPRKEKKRTIRKAPSLASTTGTSKADIFEAKVKNAVEQADSSDSEETFVYESNPPDQAPRRNHSRTPSMTSIASHNDQYRTRYRHDPNASIAGKKSMKFANNSKNVSNYPDSEDPSAGVAPGIHSNAALGSAQHPRHIGRHGRHPGHLSLFDTDAPFNNTTRSPRKATGGSFARKASPRPHTPRSSNFRGPITGKSYGTQYDLEADDERTPLMLSVRTARSSRRRPFDPREQEDYDYAQQRSTFRQMGAYMCFGSLFSLLVVLVVSALILSSRSLQMVRLKAIENVLASDKQIIFDLRVQAANPNIVSIQITDMNLFVHARSSYVGDSKWWREHGGEQVSSNADVTIQDNVDEGTDPIADDPHLMLLGQVSSFDAPLSFDASPWHHALSMSVGAVRLDRPENSTDVEKDRWETVFRHDFDLIVRGVLKYTLPISSKVRSAEISGKTFVKPSILPGPIEDPHDPAPTPEPRPPKHGNGTSSDEMHTAKNLRPRFPRAPPRQDPTHIPHI